MIKRKKKVLFIVAGDQQLPVIKYAREQNYFIITCDNEPSNPGHLLADENLFISSYSKEKVFEKIENKSINAVINFISSHGMESSSFIADKLNLPGINPITLNFIKDKEKFREFLRVHSFKVPNFRTNDYFYSNLSEGMTFPLIVKPVDRGGNVGITKVERKEDLEKAFYLAKEKSFSGKVIIEEFILASKKLNGEILIINNNLLFSFIGDYHYDNNLNSILPYATTFPSEIDVHLIETQLKKILEIIDFGSGVLNLEVIISDNEIYFIELNPRQSGNMIYKLMSQDTGENFAEIAVELALGRKYAKEDIQGTSQNLAYCILNTSKTGIMDRVEISKAIENKIIEKVMFKNSGDWINGFKTLHDRIGLLLMKFNSREEMEDIISNITNFYEVKFNK